MPFCKDCKHYRLPENGSPYRATCESPNNMVSTRDEAKYLVSGIEQPEVIAMRGATCTALRAKHDPRTDATICGPDGNWFEAK